MRHRVPSRFNWTVLAVRWKHSVFDGAPSSFVMRVLLSASSFALKIVHRPLKCDLCKNSRDSAELLQDAAYSNGSQGLGTQDTGLSELVSASCNGAGSSSCKVTQF